MRIAMVNKNKVVNIIIAENVETASLLLPKFTAVEENEETGLAWIGARFKENRFEPIRVFDSWTWNESEFTYEPPTPKPDGNYYWNEAELDWLVIPEPEIAPE